MRGALRVVALVAALTAVLASCGLAPNGLLALVPEAGVHARGDTLGNALEQPRPAEHAPLAVSAQSEPAMLQKVVLPPELAVVPKPTLAAASVGPMQHIWQSLNNCGPASVVMILSSLGVDADQETARLALRGPDWRRGMGPGPVDPWVKELYGVRAAWRNNGTVALMKALVSNGFAPMVTQWLEDPWISRISHWRTVQGYDDARRVVHVYDPMRGRIALTYEWFDRNWQPFSYRYLVIYKPEDEALLRSILGADWSERAVRASYLERARREVADRDDPASWLAYGEAAYQNGLFADAVAAFEKGMALGSAEGLFTLRTSYPQALRALGRDQEAAKVQQRVSTLTPQPAVVPTTDTIALQLAIERARLEAPYFTD